MQNTVRALSGARLQTYSLFGKTLDIKPNTTLNEKFNVQSLVAIPSGSYPILKGFAIGNKGHKYITDPNTGLSKSEPYQHEATDNAAFNHIPFVMRKLTNDLSSVERAKYAMRVIVTVNSVQYACYYIKRVDVSSIPINDQFKTIVDGVTTITSYTPTANDLNPVPVDLSTSGTNSVDGKFVGVSAILDLSLDANDMTELMNVATILYQDSGYAIISEIAMITGVDKVVSANDSSGNTFNYTELIAAQIHTFWSQYIDCKNSASGVELTVNAGVSDPLYNIR